MASHKKSLFTHRLFRPITGRGDQPQPPQVTRPWRIVGLLNLAPLVGCLILGWFLYQGTLERWYLLNELNQTTAELSQATNNESQLQAANDELELTVIEQQARLGDLQVSLDSQVQRSVDLDQALMTERSQAAQLRAGLETLTSQRQALLHQQSSEHQQRTVRETELATQISERDAQLSQLNGRIEGLQQRVDEQEALAARVRELLGLPSATGPAGGDSENAASNLAAIASAPASSEERIARLMQRSTAVQKDLRQAEQVLQQRIASLRNLTATGRNVRLSAAAAAQAPIGRPVNGPVTSNYGMRISPITKVPAFHGGIDLAVRIGTPVRTTQAGQVITAGFSPTYGQVVIIRHAAGFETLYGHNSRLLVRVGQRVARGETIALSGNTGLSTGPHVHYEIRYQGATIDPAPMMAAR